MKTDPGMFGSAMREGPSGGGLVAFAAGARPEVRGDARIRERTTDRGLGAPESARESRSAETLPTDAPAEAPAAEQATRDEVDSQVSGHLRPMLHPEEDDLEDGDERPRWVRAKMPKNEWERALKASDAALEKAQPGSEQFARLMEARMRMHLPRPKNLNWEEIEAFKSAQYRAALADDLKKELKRQEGFPTGKAVIGVAVVLLFLMCGYFVYALLSGSPPPPKDGAPTNQPAVKAPPRDESIPAPRPVQTNEPAQPTAAVTVAPTDTPATPAPPRTNATSAAAKPTNNSALSSPPAATSAPTTKPSAAPTGEGLFFKPAPR